MGMPRYAKRRDGNEPEIFQLLHGSGLSVFPIDTPCDALVGLRGITYLIEIKRDEKAPHTKAQRAFYETWKGSPVIRLNSVEEAAIWIEQVRFGRPL